MNEWSNISSEDINSGKYVFRNVFEIYRYLREEKGWSFGWYAAPYFEIMQLKPTELVAAPMPMSPLFRGQNSFYEPSYPSLYRRRMSELDMIERDVKLEDFKSILNENPEIKDHIESRLSINYNGLAQHYGIETNIIDLTNSFGVAAFFATTYYDAVSDNYFPISWCVSKGVIYFMPDGGLLDNMASNREDYILPIGMEALARPGEQRGFGAALLNGDNFNNICPCKFFFWHNWESSLECFNRFAGGKALFPYDPMAEKVREIKKYRIYGEDSLKKVVDCLENQSFSYEQIKSSLENVGCCFYSTTPFKYTKEEIKYITKLYHKRYPGSFPNSRE